MIKKFKNWVDTMVEKIILRNEREEEVYNQGHRDGIKWAKENMTIK